MFENEPYTVTAENFIQVCSFCYPGNSILALFPDLAHCTISHGVCKGHASILLAEMKRLNKGIDKP